MDKEMVMKDVDGAASWNMLYETPPPTSMRIRRYALQLNTTKSSSGETRKSLPQ